MKLASLAAIGAFGFAACRQEAAPTSPAKTSVPAPTPSLSTASIQQGWIARAPMPVASMLGKATDAGGTIYYAGGVDATGPSAGLVAYNPSTDQWSTLASLPEPRFDAAGLVALDNRLFLAGGRGEFGGRVTSSLFVYDIVTNTWKGAAPMPTPGGCGGGDTVAGQIYIFSGCSNDDYGSDNLYRYSPTLDVWTELPRPPHEHAYPAVGNVGGRLVVAGGSNAQAIPTGVVDAFDPASGQWQTVAAMSAPRTHGASTVAGGQLYVIGGAGQYPAVFSSGEVFNPALNTWTPLPDYPIALLGAAAATVDNAVFVVGGASPGSPTRVVYALGLGSPTVTPQEAIQYLMADVRALVLQLGLSQDQGLLAKLAAAIPSLDRGRTNAACNQLGAFVNQVNGLVRAGKLTAAAAQDLIDAAEGIRNQIGCATTILLAKLSQTHTCAIVQGVTYCWGNNSNGQLGNGTTISSSIPVKVVSPLNFSALIEAGTGTIGLTGNRTYYTWGLTPSATSSTTPVLDQGLTAKSLSQLATGYNFACGIAPDHLAYCWGNNESGQLGDGTTTPRYVIGPPVGSGLQFVSLSSSSSLTHMCGLTATGKAYCWGFNFFGQLGDGTSTDRMSPVAVSTSLNFVELATGSFHTCARTASDELYCWGTMPGVSTESTPTFIGREPPLIGIVSGQAGSCVLTRAGEARCWGGNGWGTIGDGTWIDRSTPTTVVGGISFAALSMGAGHVCGVTRDNKMFCWGFNDLGQLGDGTTMNRNTPQPVLLPSLP